MFSVAIETMIDEMRSLVMKTALIRPHTTPTAAAIANKANQPRPWRMPRVSATYCATEAVAVKEMSMPPATSTTSSPEARMPTKALDVRRSNRFCRVRKLSVASDRTSASAPMTTSSQNSWLRRKRASALTCGLGSVDICQQTLGIDHRLQLLLRGGVRDAFADEAPAAHHHDAMRVVEDLGDLVRDQQNGDPLAGQRTHHLVDAVLGRDVDAHRRV